jgi:integrase
MASINFYLKDSQKEETLIFLFLRVKKKTLKVHTGQRVPTKYWDAKNQRPKKSYSRAPELKVFLNNLETNAGKFLLEESANDAPPNLAKVKEQILNSIRFEDAIPEKKEGFFDVYDEFLEVYSIDRSSRTIQKYRTLRQQLLDFQKRKKVKVKFENIDARFFDKLANYYFKDLNSVNNTFGKYVATFKTFMNWATDRGYNTRMDYRKFKVLKEDADIIVLTTGELENLYNLDLSGNKTLQKVRDVFCLGCYTGLRFSDLEQLRPEHYKGNSLLIKTYKTRDTVNIPLRNEAQTIINKYLDNPHFLPVITNQRTNIYLKELCQLAGINETTTVSKYRGARRIEFTKPKYEFITSHCARRTFVTQALEAGVRPELVMSVTGHKSYKTFKKYIKITDKVVENEFQRIWKRDQSGEKSFMKVAN